MTEKSDYWFLARFVGRLFIGYLSIIAIFGVLAPDYLFHELFLRPIETRFDYLFHCLLDGVGMFSVWQVGFYVSELGLFVYRKLVRKGRVND